MGIPELTNLQFTVLRAVGGQERPGKYIREQMEKDGVRKSLTAFYQLMSRMEDADLVKGSNHRIDVAGQMVTERRYKITGTGVNSYNAFREFAIASPAIGKVGVR